MINVQKRVGRPKKVDGEESYALFVCKADGQIEHVEELLELFEPLFGIKVSYKMIERLYR